MTQKLKITVSLCIEVDTSCKNIKLKLTKKLTTFGNPLQEVYQLII